MPVPRQVATSKVGFETLSGATLPFHRTIRLSNRVLVAALRISTGIGSLTIESCLALGSRFPVIHRFPVFFGTKVSSCRRLVWQRHSWLLRHYRYGAKD
jgi:hypothetical protein